MGCRVGERDHLDGTDLWLVVALGSITRCEQHSIRKSRMTMGYDRIEDGGQLPDLGGCAVLTQALATPMELSLFLSPPCGGDRCVPEFEMYGSNIFEGSGQQVIDMGDHNPEWQWSTRSYASPYGNPELDYVYLGSPESASPFLNPGGSSFIPSPLSHHLQPTPGNAFVDQHPLVERGGYEASTSYQLPPQQQFAMHQQEQQQQLQPSFYDVPMEPEDDIWANLEAILLAQKATEQYGVSPGDMGLVENLFEPGPSTHPRSQPHPRPPPHSGLATIWGTPSQVEGSSSGQATTSIGRPSTTRRDGSLPRPGHHLGVEVAQSSLYSMDMVMQDVAVSAPENPPRHEVIRTETPYGYTVQSNSGITQDTGRQRFAHPESNFKDVLAPADQLQAAGGGHGGGSRFPAESMSMNDFTQLMTPGLLAGVGQLGESRWAVQLLNLCAATIASENISRTQHLMWVLNDLASAHGDVNQRFAAYGLKALFSRITDNPDAAATFARPRHIEQEISFGADRVHRALVRFHDHVPWHQNCYTVSSQTLLEVCAGKSRLHLIDIGAGKGIEWPIFIDALANRTGGPPSILRITMIRDLRREEHKMRHAKSVNSDAADFMTRLVKFASGLGLHVEVNMVSKALECVTRDDLRLRNGEILAVVAQFRLHRLMEEVPAESMLRAGGGAPALSPRDMFLDFVFALSPHVFILSENNVDHCSADFLTRFHNTCAYWWLLYESLDIGYNGKDVEERQIIEYEAGKMWLNNVACEGIARIERNETYENWERRVRRAGFVPKNISDDTRKACHALVQNHSEFWDITGADAENPNMICLRWRRQPTTFTSIWATSAVACSKPACKCSMLHN